MGEISEWSDLIIILVLRLFFFPVCLCAGCETRGGYETCLLSAPDCGWMKTRRRLGEGDVPQWFSQGWF